MFAYEVLVGSLSFRGNRPLTYLYDKQLKVGIIVKIPLRNKTVLGIVVGKTSTIPPKAKKIIEPAPWPTLPPQLLKLHDWLYDYYGAGGGSIVQLILPNFLLSSKFADFHDEIAREAHDEQLPPLTKEQTKVIKRVDSTQAASTHLLHGITGSGKTRVYAELARKTLNNKQSVIVLVPEIGLSSQIEQQITRLLCGYPIIRINSHMTPAQRRTAWLRILHANQPIIVIGPRSALFSPVHNLGLIVIDEEHDSSYKQEQAPYYHATRVAAVLSKLHGCTLLLGSATPSVHDYYLATQKNAVLKMEQLAINSDHDAPQAVIVDLTDKNQFSSSRIISNPLRDAIETALTDGRQSLLFLNRRGTARAVVCQDCGWQATCPHCQLPLTFHHPEHALRCHTCGYRATTPVTCPECNSTDILFKIPGTKAVAEELQHLFPDARIARFDGDNSTSERLEKHYESIKDGAIDIIVGTQMLVKGFDIPNLAVVGLVNADTSLAFPDYTSEERTFQLISQAIGRVGRGHGNSTIIIQTYRPDSTLIQAALANEWSTFYAHEIASRKNQSLPPFSHTLKLECARASDASASKSAKNLADALKNLYKDITILGPAPAFRNKVGSKFVWQLIITSRKRPTLLTIIKNLPSGWKYNIDPNNLL